MRTSRIVIAALFIVVGVDILLFAPPVHGAANTAINVAFTLFFVAMFILDVRRQRADLREEIASQETVGEDGKETRIQVLDGGENQ